MTDREARPVESFGTALSAAIVLVDRRTGGPPEGDPTVTVTDAAHEVVRTPSGHHVLVDLPPDPPTLTVAVETEAYLPARRPVTHGALSDDDPTVEIELEPGPAYPYGDGQTLVRGSVTEADRPVAGATVAYVQGDAVARTDAAGEYALPITGVTAADVTTDDDGDRVLQPGGNDPTIEATHPDGGTASVDVPVPLGETTSVHLSV